MGTGRICHRKRLPWRRHGLLLPFVRCLREAWNDTDSLNTRSNPSGLPPYNNTAFITTFSGAFMTFAASGKPNLNSQNNAWKTWSRDDTFEIIFNNTNGLAGLSVIHPITTSDAVLARCQ
jgi:hypothetical protein